MEKKVITCRVNNEIKELIEEVAKEERRTVSQVVSFILEDWYKSKLAKKKE